VEDITFHSEPTAEERDLTMTLYYDAVSATGEAGDTTTG
jgi:hypothetical protein